MVWAEIYAQTDPLPSWNEGAAKKSILDYVQAVTQEGNSDYLPVEDRIATFDQDGTLLVEKPSSVEMYYMFERLRLLAPQHPEWKNLKIVQEILAGDYSEVDLRTYLEMLAVTHSGMSVKAFHEMAQDWLKTAIHPRYKRPFKDLVYQPMLEVIQLFRDHGFKVYIVSGGGQEFMRNYTQQFYQIPLERILGTVLKVAYEYRDGNPILWMLPEILYVNDGPGKVEGLNLFIDKKPAAAFGNSTGDRQMLEWTQSAPGKRFELLVHHDDAEREYAYGPEAKSGTFSVDLMEEAKKRGWVVVSMKNDWKIMFPWEKEKVQGH